MNKTKLSHIWPRSKSIIYVITLGNIQPFKKKMNIFFNIGLPGEEKRFRKLFFGGFFQRFSRRSYILYQPYHLKFK